jgi:peptide/nickel transport system substrate-binding protein
MDPAIATYRTSRLVTEQLYSTLMALGPDGRPYPDLATWIEVSDDALTYTFGLVDGVRFHDGSPLTADDVAFTFQRLLDMGEAYHFDPWVATIAGADVIDAHTVRIRLSQPTGPILTWLAFCGTGIVPRAAIESGRDLMRQPIGSGPFRLAEPWAGGDAAIRLVAHDASARGAALFRPRLAGIEFHAIASAEERVAALLSGRIDLDALLDPSAFDSVAAAPDMIAHETPDSRWHWLVVNCRQAPLGDLRVRRAITLALDREMLLAPFQGLGTPITRGVVAPWSWAAAPDLASLPARGDPDEARRLLAEAGVGPDTHLEILAGESLPIAIRQAELIAGQLRAVGLGAAASVVDGATYAARVSRDGDFQLAASYWGSPIWDPDDFVWMGFRSGARYDAGSCSSSALDAFMERGRGSIDQRVRQDAYVALQAAAADLLPVIPTIQPAMLRGVSARLRGYVPTPCAQLRTLRDTWLV